MAATAGLMSYFERFQAGDIRIPSNEVLVPIAAKLDSIAGECIQQLMRILRCSKEHWQRVSLLKDQDPLAGTYNKKSSKVLLGNASPFEQMVALADWHDKAKIQEIHTFFFAAKNNTDYINVKAALPRSGGIPTLMHVVLGTSSKYRLAPNYFDRWAEKDPWLDSGQEAYIYSLEGLEFVRQPHFSAATVIKGNAYEAEFIDEGWRYGETYACVESPKQSANLPSKMRSAALNACALPKVLADFSDPTADETDFSLPIKYENYSDSGYRDFIDTSVSAGRLIKATKKALVDRQDRELTVLVENLVIKKIGVPKTPFLKKCIAQVLEMRG